MREAGERGRGSEAEGEMAVAARRSRGSLIPSHEEILWFAQCG